MKNRKIENILETSCILINKKGLDCRDCSFREICRFVSNNLYYD